METKKEKAKWTKAYKKRMKPAGTDAVDLTSNGEVSKHSESVRSRREPNEMDQSVVWHAFVSLACVGSSTDILLLLSSCC